MTPQNKLYEAAMALIGDLINRRSHFNSFQNLCRVLCEYEQEQPEAITWKKNAYESALDYLSEMGYGTGTNFSLKGVASLLADFASQQTSAKDKEIKELQQRISVIKEKLPDNKIRDLNPIWVRDEIVKRLTNK